MTATLMLHCGCGAKKASLEEVKAVKTPEATNTWSPLSHSDFIQMIKDEVTHRGYHVVRQEYGLQDGKLYTDGEQTLIKSAKMFGILALKNVTNNREGYDLAIGIRNAHDKSMATGIFLGSHMFVCDNMAYSRDIHIVRKHCPSAMLELPLQIADEIERLPQLAKEQDEKFEAYREKKLTDADFHHLLCEGLKANVLPSSKAGHLMKEWYEPEHEVFKARTVFSGFNAFTAVAKDTSVFHLPERMRSLHTLCDKFAFQN